MMNRHPINTSFPAFNLARRAAYRMRQRYLMTFLFLFVCVGFLHQSAYGQFEAKQHPKLEYALTELAQNPRAFAQLKEVSTDSLGRVKVFLIPDVGKTTSDIDLAGLTNYGVEIVKRSQTLLQAWVPISFLSSIADNVAGIGFVQLPERPVPLTTSEGVSLTGAAPYQFASTGSTGQNVKIAIIDIGFAQLDSSISAGELPSTVQRIDCTGSSCVASQFSNETEKHGTAVAEVIHDMAPDSTLYLMKVADKYDLENAVNSAIAAGVKVINHSDGWFDTNFYDGSCFNSNPNCSAETAYNSGILWINSAGNSAQNHYSGVFTDTNGNGWHEFSPTDENLTFSLSAGSTVKVYLTWDAWPVTNQDFDLYLVDNSGNVLKQSITAQTGSQIPVEDLTYKNTNLFFSQTLNVKILKFSATSNPRFHIFVDTHDQILSLSHITPSSSLLSPADSSHVMAVGAINKDNWTIGPLEIYSSQGPTSDGRTKPEIAGPDNVSNYTYTFFWFFGSFDGTSAAAPHVAGAAALIRSKNPRYTVSATWKALTDAAINMGGSTPNNLYGYGRLNLPFIIDWVTEPPATMVSGQSYQVSWRVTGGSSVLATNVRFGTNSDPLTNATQTHCCPN